MVYSLQKPHFHNFSAFLIFLSIFLERFPGFPGFVAIRFSFPVVFSETRTAIARLGATCGPLHTVEKEQVKDL